ncbi:CRE-SRW-34 protein [Caenorhabditis remanei]|uniref:CRE-SRW-34 protein n=1 Tax=Caenorhabditis remanei TaxID=31234 RepID=E3LJG4_CAERE|nr:CRE-SRW-34 protein [Caenorhabditis remanei]
MNSDNNFAALWFPELNGKSRKFWNTIRIFLEELSGSLLFINIAVSVIGIILNVFHLIVLTRKTMKSLTINVFLIGIGACDVIRMICKVWLLFPATQFLFIDPNISFGCLNPLSYIAMVTMNFSLSTEKTTRQLSVWYGVTIAILRALALRYPLNPRIGCLINAKYGLRVLIVISIFFFPFWMLSYAQISVKKLRLWKPYRHCRNYPKNYSQVEYIYETVEIFGQSYHWLYKFVTVFEGVLSRLIPCVLLSVSTVVLLIEMQKTRKISNTAIRESNHRSTHLVMFITVTFLISNGPLGITYLLEFVVYDRIGFA